MTNDRDLENELRLLLGEPSAVVVWDEGVSSPANIVLNRNKSLIRLSKVLLGLIVISIGASATLGYSVLSLSQRDMVELAYGIDEENRIIELSETSIPTVNEGDVKLRAGELVSKLHKYSTTDWQLQTDSFERDFVDSDAHREFVKALDRSQIIRTINTGVQLTWAEITEAPRIVDIADDGSSWEIELPFTWYIGGGQFTSAGSSYIAHMTLVRVPRSRNRFGLAISEYSDEPIGGRR
ncbi:DotI/IcmL/TraM family protein [Paraglaciecola chathamensis]|jgi:intracellular multiplication protein IcmL|uniref:Uncharacterized protein n=1 Tax=Paraglaciecola chathamensis TaxID=368405 RepID=A0A8H9IDZ1_9ALTE|nr:DotI/IcmL/TraM family protein [Paraglaciecola oceanifecundans]AEE25283.1 hypothetical protein Glaag_4361 [Glaciecola sp. 4H-3-7+YE-5]GGZ82697.1 hypothetical protein GCM10011274_45510 [Paraglaciecola oceanifecundans]|tara:strand:+ start:16218 stop:16931 length:714 start_codon:yes stop_codon:yes gene_type:complete